MDRFAIIVADPVKAMLIKVWSYVPAILGAIVILVVGWIVAKFVEAIVVRALKAARLDVVSDKAGLANMLAQGDIKWTLSELVGVMIYWVVILSVLASALSALNLTVAGDLLSVPIPTVSTWPRMQVLRRHSCPFQHSGMNRSAIPPHAEAGLVSSIR